MLDSSYQDSMNPDPKHCWRRVKTRTRLFLGVALEEDKNTYYLFRGVTEALEGNKVEGVVNVAGGWAGGSTKDPKWINNAELMWKQSG
jgi:hypothetical protein